MCTVIFRVIVFVLFGVAGTNGADCPELEFNPPRVVVRYGGSVSVNCSTTTTGHEGMGWEATRGGTGLVEDVSYLIWTYKNIDNWNIEPRCFLNKEDGGQCREILPLVIYKPPDSVSISLDHTGPMVEGTEYQLSCDVLNVAPVQYLTVTWYKGNETVNTTSSDDRIKTPVKTSSILTITPSRHDDGAQYSCEAQLDLGPEGPQPPPTMTSEPLNITVHYKPVIHVNTSQFAALEHRDSLSMVQFRADGNPEPSVEWYLEGRQVNASKLLTRGDSGEYVLSATNDLGNTNSTVYITVEYPPELSCPDHYDGVEGQIHSLTCTVEGSPAPTLTWMKDGKQVEMPSYLTRTDRGEYIVSAANKHGQTNHTVDVNVLYKPVIHVNTSQFAALEHRDSLSMVQFRADGNPEPSVEWYLEGRQVNASKLLTRGDSGEYVLSATNDLGNTNSTVYITVEYPPELSCPDHYEGVEGQIHSLTCTVEGSPAPTLTWMKDGKQVEMPSYLTRTDRGEYIVSAANKHGQTNHTVDVNVLYPPSEILELEDTEGDAGSTLELRCSSSGNPQPSYRWSYYLTPNTAVESKDGAGLLTIREAGGINIGSYGCSAQNELGSVSKTARVAVRGATAECPITISPARVLVEYGRPVSATCNATGSPSSVESLYWSPDSSSQNAAWQTDSLLDFNSSPRCIGNFTGIGECSKTLDITLYKNPDSVSIFPVDHTGPMVEGTEYRLSCDVLNVAPVQYLTVTWYKGNETINTTSSDDRMKTPVKTSSILTITPSRHDDGAQYRCEAQLDLGPEGPQPPPTMTSEPLNITVHYKPHINATKLPARIPVLRGYPEDLVCEAEGYPTPRIKWEYSVGMKAGGNLTVREAGHYNCTATNVVGTTFIVVEVVLKEDYLPLIAGFVAIAVGVISAVFVFIFFIYYKNTRMGHYSLKNAKLTNSLNGNVAQNGRETPLPMMKVC